MTLLITLSFYPSGTLGYINFNINGDINININKTMCLYTYICVCEYVYTHLSSHKIFLQSCIWDLLVSGLTNILNDQILIYNIYS